MEHLTILDFNTGEVHIYPVEFEQEPCIEDLLGELGHRANDCEWMFSNGDIKIHSSILKEEKKWIKQKDNEQGMYCIRKRRILHTCRR